MAQAGGGILSGSSRQVRFSTVLKRDIQTQPAKRAAHGRVGERVKKYSNYTTFHSLKTSLSCRKEELPGCRIY